MTRREQRARTLPTEGKPDRLPPRGELLDVRGLGVLAQPKGGFRRALVRDATFSVRPGEVVCLVGESGSGKSVTALALMGLIQAQRGICTVGAVTFDGQELFDLPPERYRELRGRDLAMVFQEPMSSLDPVMTIGSQLLEAQRRQERLDRTAEHARAEELLREVGIPDPAGRLAQYPHELSGGICQRVMIAMALACQPKLLIADEPTTALDVTVQAQLLRLLIRLKDEKGMAILLITHDMGVAAAIADRVIVMYAGRIVEEGSPASLFSRPLHPYTAGLLACVPRIDGPRPRLLPSIRGAVPDPARVPPGCAFHPRCLYSEETCRTVVPRYEELAADRRVACLRASELCLSGIDHGAGQPANGIR